MKQPDDHHLFGPVPSRRFGCSLGIDLTPHKTCSLDCVFCQFGQVKDIEGSSFSPPSLLTF